ncbi:unnamed protein product [Mytilus edulis]|uniref:Reverse transcriptase domain-containing protein n=1 Tax=Mytilus edulis TaxID=6550 RepID=A0A8S3TG04_MYTED|nr:unnamed protein product [Mytilus edulis]
MYLTIILFYCLWISKIHFGQLAENTLDENFDSNYLKTTENEYKNIIELCIEEFERENKDLKRPTYIGLLDAKSAFDVVVHANLIKRLHQYGFSNQSILLIDNLYQNAVSYVKWDNSFSEDFFKIEQGVRQGGTLSADLYKLYINPLLNFLCDSGLGGKIGNINCCAPTCADDIALLACNPLDIQTMVDIAVDFSKREGYHLQPSKSVILPVKSKAKSMETNLGFWKLNDTVMPVVDKASHIGITRSQNNSAQTTVDENLKKTRRAIYSLMGTGLHGENGLDPETSIAMLRTYILPILTYGLEIVIPKGKILDNLQIQYKKLLKQILSLNINVADPAVYLISGLLPIEAEIHLKILSLFGNIARANKNSSEWRLAERQLQIKSFDSNSWFIDMKKICIKYNLENPLSLLYNEMSKGKWKKMTTTAVHKYWTTRINEEIMYYSSLKYIPTSSFKVGKIHPLALANSANQRDINRIPIRIKIATGTYILQTNRAAYNQNNVDPTCKLCDQAEESLSHFLLCCRALDQIRTPILKNIICKCSELLALQHSNIQLDILQLIINPFHYAGSVESENDISCRIEPLCRQLIYNLHNKRYEILSKMDLISSRRKMNFKVS